MSQQLIREPRVFILTPHDFINAVEEVVKEQKPRSGALSLEWMILLAFDAVRAFIF